MNTMNALGYGGIVALIGMIIVFMGLTILIVILSIMGKVFQSIDKSKAAKAAAAAPAPAPAPAPVVEAAPVAEESSVVDDAELIAVIAAAIAAAIAAYDNSGKNLVVRKVRRVAGWKDAARSEQVYHF